MPEPIDPIVRCPMGGWPKAAVRVELVGVTTLEDAVYQLAGLARANRVGFVAAWWSIDLYAYPHQDTQEIARAYRKVRAMQDASLAMAPVQRITRWTAKRKLGLVVALAEGFIGRSDALRTYGLTDEELTSWEARFAAFGRDGLAVTQLKALRHIPEGDAA